MNQKPTTHTERCLLTDLFGRDEIDRQPLSVAGHHAFREGLAASMDAMSEPIRDHLPQQASKRKTKGVLSILDQLDREDAKSNRRFNR